MPHGISFNEAASGGALQETATAVIGVVVTAPAADAAAFPLDTPVLVTNLAAAATALGATGTGRAVATAMAEVANAKTVFVRVAPGVDAAATDTAVIGTDDGGHKTGLQALLSAQAVTSVRPRIIGAPGLDTEDVAGALATLGGKLNGMAYAHAIGATAAEAAAYRAGFSARELMLLWPDFTKAGASAIVVARALAMRALIDQTQGWHKTLSNVPVPGVTGVNPGVSWDLHSDDTDAGVLNAADVTTLIQRNGFRFWGSRTCSSDDAYSFESAVRTNQVLKDTIGEGLFDYVDKPLTPSLAKDLVAHINALFRRLKTQNRLIGAKAYISPAANAAGDLAAGKLAIGYDFTPTPPLEDLSATATITDVYFADFAAAASG